MVACVPIHIYNESHDTTLCGITQRGWNCFFVSPENMYIWGEYRRHQTGFFFPENTWTNCTHCVRELDHLLALRALEQVTR